MDIDISHDGCVDDQDSSARINCSTAIHKESSKTINHQCTQSIATDTQSRRTTITASLSSKPATTQPAQFCRRPNPNLLSCTLPRAAPSLHKAAVDASFPNKRRKKRLSPRERNPFSPKLLLLTAVFNFNHAEPCRRFFCKPTTQDTLNHRRTKPANSSRRYQQQPAITVLQQLRCEL
ncbi:hypothetical protein M0R45_026740 [Rubus argutus]|uniref:Uncharacterized protein n=1 Tax=Rubus argutus TaxID=59490 RepID=A0AAW1WYB2_RUBAR